MCLYVCRFFLTLKTGFIIVNLLFPTPLAGMFLFPLSFHGSMVMGDLEGHCIDVCVSRSFRGEIRGENSGSDVPKRGYTE